MVDWQCLDPQTGWMPLCENTTNFPATKRGVPEDEVLKMAKGKKGNFYAIFAKRNNGVV